jgi:hypothetical protein
VLPESAFQKVLPGGAFPVRLPSRRVIENKHCSRDGSMPICRVNIQTDARRSRRRRMRRIITDIEA